MPKPTLKLPPKPAADRLRSSQRPPLRGGKGKPALSGGAAARATAGPGAGPKPRKPAGPQSGQSATYRAREATAKGGPQRDPTTPERGRRADAAPETRQRKGQSAAPRFAPSGESRQRDSSAPLRRPRPATAKEPGSAPGLAARRGDAATPSPRARRDGAQAGRATSPAPSAKRRFYEGRDAAAAAPGRREDAGTQPRLSKLMSERGLCSRREADEWIEAGWVSVAGHANVTLGTRVAPDAVIEIDPRARGAQAERVTILLNKPVGYVSGQPEDGYPPAVSLIRAESRWEDDGMRRDWGPECLRGLAPAGRLDIDSTGLLVFTQDGRIARALIGESSLVEKEYLVRVSGQLPAHALALLQEGLALDGVALKPAKVSWANDDQLRFVLREGRKRQIRRMCEMVGLRVTGLKRIRIGSVKLGGLPAGNWRFLRPDEKF